MSSLTLVDRFGRIHRSLRISVTDRCNIRCQYCMTDGPIRFLAKERLLTFEQIAKFVSIVAPLGITRLRLTGGEPLVRMELYRLVEALKKIDLIEEVALTTNGILLASQIDDLLRAGLDRINISLDTLREETFRVISRREGLHAVLEGIDAAITRGISPRLNALVLRDINLMEVLELVEFACDRGLNLRFIEFMPLDQERQWQEERMVSGRELRDLIETRFGTLEPIVRERSAQPAQDYRLPGRMSSIGFIDPVSRPFCGDCDRLRITADGKIRNCLFGREEWDIKQLFDSETCDSRISKRIEERVRSALEAKHRSHGIAEANFEPPQRAMYQIGG